MKKILLAASAVCIFFTGCSRLSPVQEFRASNESESHKYQVYFDWWATRFDVVADGKTIASDITNGTQFSWNGRNYSTEVFIGPGFIFFGVTRTVIVSTGNERVGRFEL